MENLDDRRSSESSLTPNSQFDYNQQTNGTEPSQAIAKIKFLDKFKKPEFTVVHIDEPHPPKWHCFDIENTKDSDNMKILTPREVFKNAVFQFSKDSIDIHTNVLKQWEMTSNESFKSGEHLKELDDPDEADSALDQKFDFSQLKIKPVNYDLSLKDAQTAENSPAKLEESEEDSLKKKKAENGFFKLSYAHCAEVEESDDELKF